MKKDIARIEKGREELLRHAQVEDIKAKEKQRKGGKNTDLTKIPSNLVSAVRKTGNFSKSSVI